jgi:hypothetical protein
MQRLCTASKLILHGREKWHVRMYYTGLVFVRVYIGLFMRICPCIAYMYASLYLCLSVCESVRAYSVTAHVPGKLRPVGVFTKLI